MLTKVRGNLFSLKDKNYALAHCISKDIKMGKGIAVSFDHNFPQMKNSLLNMRTNDIPQVIKYEDRGQIVYNLITKNNYFNKPLRKDFNECLLELFKTMNKNNEHQLAIPMIGSGLDRLTWNITEKYLIELSNKYNVDVLVYKL